MVPPFVPSDFTVSVVSQEILRALEMLLEVDLTALMSTETRLTVRGEEKPFQWEVGPTEMQKQATTTPVNQQRRALSDGNLPGMPTGHSLSFWRWTDGVTQKKQHIWHQPEGAGCNRRISL